MKLYLKIFLWFLAAIALMVGVVIFVTRSFQTEPMVSRWQRSTKNHLIFYGSSVEQVRNLGGNAELASYLEKLRDAGSISDVVLFDSDKHVLIGDPAIAHELTPIIPEASATTEPILIVNDSDPAIGGISVKFADGTSGVLAIRWEPPRGQSLFFDSLAGWLRFIGLVFTAAVLCYLLAAYLTTPIRKLREVTHRLAAGELDARVPPRLKKRRDEIADLSKDFDVMAERIESLITSQQRLSRDISHELRSPLARMNVALEIAKQRANEETLPILERIENESARLNEMIGRILTLARLESGSNDIQKSPVNLTEVVKDVAEDADFEARGKGKSVVVLRADECRLTGNENLLRSAVENVVRNAVKYTDDNTSVAVSLEVVNGSAKIKIADQGTGVPESEIEKLFLPFYRLAEARDRKSGGTGLGLAIAQRAIAAHKGSIKARNLDHGLEIEIILDRPKN